MNDYRPIEISRELVDKMAERAGIVKICEFDSYCRDSSENARQDIIVNVTGIDKQGKKKKYFFQITSWEEIVHDEN